MSNFRKGTAEIKKTAESKGGKRNWTPNIYWNDGDIRTVVFTTPADEIPKVKLHQMVRIPDDKFEKGYRFESFLCRKDPSMLEETGGDCILCDHIGHNAADKFVAMAIELEPVKEGKRVTSLDVKYNTYKREDGTEQDFARWGLVIQGAKNFFSTLAAYDEAKGDITEVAFEIQREGASISTKYHFFPENVALPDLTEVLEEVPALDSILEDMGSDDQYAKLEGVEPGSQPTFGNSSNEAKPAATSNGNADRESRFQKVRERVEGKAPVESY